MRTDLLGQRAYGFAAASQVYFGKKLNELTVAEMQRSPACRGAQRLQPVRQSEAAKSRQQYVLTRMLDLGYIDRPTYDTALEQELSRDRLTDWPPNRVASVACGVRRRTCPPAGL